MGHRKGITIASLNVNGLLLDIDEIRMLVNESVVRISTLNETKLDKRIDDRLVYINGYRIKRSDTDGNWVSVANYLKDTFLDKSTMGEGLPYPFLPISSLWLGAGLLTQVFITSIIWKNVFNF